MPDVVNISTTECQYFCQGGGVKDKLVFCLENRHKQHIVPRNLKCDHKREKKLLSGYFDGLVCVNTEKGFIY